MNLPTLCLGLIVPQIANGTMGREAMYCMYPRLGIQQSLPPILVEIQSTVDEAFMRRLIQYCENITNVYGKYPVVLILCINKVSPSNLMTKFDAIEAKQWLRSIISCDFWAKSCYLVTDSTLSSADATTTLTPLQALATFMIERSPTLYGSSHPDNPTIRHFYCIARDIIDHNIENERELIDVVDVVCTNNLKILDKLHGIITNTGTGYSSARRLIQIGMDYNTSVKRKFETAESDISLEPLPKLHLAKKTDKHKTKDDNMAYIMDYLAKHKGKMNWKSCLESGHSKQKLLSFGTKEALRSFYNKNKPH